MNFLAFTQNLESNIDVLNTDGSDRYKWYKYVFIIFLQVSVEVASLNDRGRLMG